MNKLDTHIFSTLEKPLTPEQFEVYKQGFLNGKKDKKDFAIIEDYFSWTSYTLTLFWDFIKKYKELKSDTYKYMDELSSRVEKLKNQTLSYEERINNARVIEKENSELKQQIEYLEEDNKSLKLQVKKKWFNW